ncbi:hypothetical protein JNL27_00910 [bacterium]|nr:hypothetical protein [bacterium]
MDFFQNEIEEEIKLSDDERSRILSFLAKLVQENSNQGISIVALKNAKITKPVLVQLAKEGVSNAVAVLSELNLRGILEEAKNPDTKEEIATEMLARLVICNVPVIRRRAIHLLLKINSEKLIEVLNDKGLTPNTRSDIFSDVISDEETSLRVMLRLLRNTATPHDVKERIITKIARIRKNIEENSSQIIDWNHRIEDLEKRKRIKFHTIEKYHREVMESLDEFKTIPNFVMDLKFDVELAFENLKNSVKEQ